MPNRIVKKIKTNRKTLKEMLDSLRIRQQINKNTRNTQQKIDIAQANIRRSLGLNSNNFNTNEMIENLEREGITLNQNNETRLKAKQKNINNNTQRTQNEIDETLRVSHEAIENMNNDIKRRKTEIKRLQSLRKKKLQSLRQNIQSAKKRQSLRQNTQSVKKKKKSKTRF